MEKNHQKSHPAGKKPLKIVFFGPESTGKTTLASALAEHFNTSWSPEYMREYLQKKWDEKKEVCTWDDLLPIAEGQMKNEATAESDADKLVFYDTNLLQIKVYSEIYYNGNCPEEIKQQVQEKHYDFYFLLYIDTPWEADDLRDKPHEREMMFQRFKKELDINNCPYQIIKGTFPERLKIVTGVVQKLVNLQNQNAQIDQNQ
jgi:HTH-type transcriptional regulator, transcriptional repressor of NAD biosynthesis genes